MRAKPAPANALVRWLSLLLLGAWGCAHETPPPAEHASTQEAPPPEPQEVSVTSPTEPEVATVARPPALIEVRVLLVAYRGATGASAEQTRTQAQALERARMISALARGGEHLNDLIPTYSDRPIAADYHGVARIKTAAPDAFTVGFVKAAVALPVGSVSDPMSEPEGYMVMERLPDPATGPTRIGAKHILISYAGASHALPGATRTEAEALKLAQQIVAKAKAPDADWNALAAQYTEEPGGKERSGDLGTFGHGQMVPAFDHAAFALKVGEVSGAVQSPFGFHVIKRYE